MKMMNSLLAATALVGALAVSPASATTITFNNLAGANGDAFTTYTESGFTVSKLSGSPMVAKQFGDPIPDIFFDPGLSSLNLTGGLFTFASADVSANNGTTVFSITGYLNNAVIYSNSATRNMNATFSTLASGSNLTFDRVVLGFNVGGTSANIDNIVVNSVAAVPEPATWAMMLVGFGMMGATMRYRRRSTTTVYA